MGRENASASPRSTGRRRQTPLRGCILIFFRKRQLSSPLCVQQMQGLVHSHPLGENSYFFRCKNSQELPVRINIAFDTSKELLMSGQRQEAEQKEVAASSLGYSVLHMYLLRATTISLKGGGGRQHRSKVSHRQVWPCASQGHSAPQRDRYDPTLLAPCCCSGGFLDAASPVR